MEDEENTEFDLNPMETDPGKMFIGGLPSQTTADILQRYFEKFGEVKESVVMRDSVTKRSRGFGFVRFVDPKSVDQVQSSCPHIIDGKKIDPKRAVPKKSPLPGQNQFKKVFVGGLPPDTTARDLTEYFEAFGKVTEVLLMHDRTTKRLRGFGFVTFESDDAGKHVCETGFHKLKGKNVECKRAQPKEAMMLQVNLAPFSIGRGYHNGLSTVPIGFGFPDWTCNPQIYQHLANSVHFGRGRGYTSNYQGFINVSDHRRGNDQYFSEYTPVQTPTTIRTDVLHSNDCGQEYEQNNFNTVGLTYHSATNTTPASPLSQVFNQTASGQDLVGYTTNSRAGLSDHHLYHNGHHACSNTQATFCHRMPQITLRQ
ncbi:RNA-binding protein Musashi homolog 1 isoform X2 [Hydra vulgaris]|uniref:RNA-binding protein Musashi homolog 1 isoform X4 n=1 Tax=Hydra vulgaris TaxID=6087 RepID=A0ABM4CNY4_HYDVU|nr:RNA-binding protein Musashi homolog 2 isoform X2 [Hydra vulgaris]